MENSGVGLKHGRGGVHLSLPHLRGEGHDCIDFTEVTAWQASGP